MAYQQRSLAALLSNLIQQHDLKGIGMRRRAISNTMSRRRVMLKVHKNRIQNRQRAHFLLVQTDS
ncbi:hypothetical protein ACROAE_00015 [Shewanella sp. MF05960]|uniref:hypothetical protein n=1 Tax=Shewanella sp. MF05960 TaxID=3434874 RepID=UPI003D7AAD98